MSGFLSLDNCLFNWMLQDFQEEKPLKITGPPDKVEFAKQRVEQVFIMLDLCRLGKTNSLNKSSCLALQMVQMIAEEQEKMGGFRGGRGGGGGRGGFRGRGDGESLRLSH